MEGQLWKGIIGSPPINQLKSSSDRVAEYFIVCGMNKSDPVVIGGLENQSLSSRNCSILDIEAGTL
jgi:hypothetical protein